MPELPEVETSRRGIEPFLVGERIDNIQIREPRLRWPVEAAVARNLSGQTINSVTRRAKYLLINTSNGSAMIHLGMSGSVYIVDRDTPASYHEHFDFDLASGKTLRYRDPRRFGSLHWTDSPTEHKLLKSLGPEPLGDEFSGPSIDDVVTTVDRLNRADAQGNRRVRIHGVGFPVMFTAAARSSATGERFATLMRELAHRNGGTFVGLNSVKR